MLRIPVFLAGLGLAISPASAATQCDDPLIRVNIADSTLAETVCDVATRAIATMRACNLPLALPVEIETVGVIDQVGGSALGSFVAADRRISIFGPGKLPEVIDEGNPFRHIDTDIYFNSLLVHELGHAAFDEVPCPAKNCMVASSYVAFAMQIRSLPPSQRAFFLKFKPIERDVQQAELSAFLVSVAPMVFAAKTWRHFSAPGNGCEFIRRLVNGDAVLDRPEE